ncbi:hypothetical protein G6Z34_13700 [Clostridium perfringens]|uniref:Uncharacterized protein n=1 Tax=Clostridium perfringens TaxID=1502 RepID=A0AAP6WQ36_CLOPF|nr:hypothetical protein [Clostridium perfringens]NGU31141.1 hypothetical protein [Clostridium perfringens]
MVNKKWIKIGSIVKCTNKTTTVGCRIVGETEDIGCYGIVVGHDRKTSSMDRDYYRIYFTSYSNFIGVEDKYVEETDFTTPELEAKRELVLENIKAGNITPYVLYGDILTKEVCIVYNKRKGWVDLDEEGNPYTRHDWVVN